MATRAAPVAETTAAVVPVVVAVVVPDSDCNESTLTKPTGSFLSLILRFYDDAIWCSMVDPRHL